jgi:tetratricopeptide (TPR) repeat protein
MKIKPSHNKEKTMILRMRVISLAALMFLFSPIFFANTMISTEETIDELIKNGDYGNVFKNYLGQDLSQLCLQYARSGDFSKAEGLLEYLLQQRQKDLNQAENDSELKNQAQKQINNIHYIAAESLRIQGKYIEALKRYDQMTTQPLDFYLTKGHCYIGLYLNTNEKNYEKEALDNYNIFLELYNKMSEEEQTQENIKKNYGYYLWGLSQLDLKNKEYDEACIKYKKAIQNSFDKDPQGKAYMNLIQAEIHIELNESESIKDNFNKLNACIECFKEIQDFEGLITAYCLISKINHEKAKDAYDQAMELVKKYGFEQFSRFYKTE